MDNSITPGSEPYTLSYRDEGSGLPVLLLHGFAEDNRIWDNQISYLGTRCRVIAPDLPGSGRSSPLPDFMTIEAFAASIKGFLDRLGIEKCILIGHSMGGYIALAFAEIYPQRLLAPGLFHSTAYPDTDEKKSTRRKAIEFIENNGAAAFIRQSTPNLFSPHTRENRPELIDTLVNNYSDFSPQSLISYYQAMIARPDRTGVLRQFQGPVLFIIGEDDTIIPSQQVFEQSHLPAVSHIHLVKNAGHEGMIEAPEECNKIVLDFINFVQHS